jgi:putative PEP-CTERM system histidine kinase
VRQQGNELEGNVSLQHAILLAAMVCTVLPVVAVFLRGRSRRLLTAATLLAAATTVLFLGVLLRLLALAPQYVPNGWVHVLVGAPVLLLLSGYVLSLSFGRERPEESLRDARRTLGLLVVLGGAFLTLLRHPAFVTGYEWFDERGTVHFGFLGKAYCGYLLIGIVLVGHNLETTYRVSSSEHRSRIRPAILGLFGVLAFFTLILATGMLYSSIGMGRLIAAGMPIACAGVLIAHGYLRGAISDAAAPVSRSFVYTSFTALAAGLFVLSIAVAAQLATLTRWSPDEVLIFAFGFLALLITVMLSISNRFQRRIRRFIDRNFYVNRYDYRAQWSKLTGTLEDAIDRDAILDRVTRFLADAFSADDVTIAVRDEATHEVRPVRGKGVADPGAVLAPGSPLFERLVQQRKTLLLDRNPHDLTYVGIYAENQGWLDTTASRMIAPLAHGASLLGTLGLQRKAGDDRFTFEDVALLDSICAHVAAALHSIRLANELAESRETELVSQWSSMILHDLKNYLTPLRLAASNLAESEGDAEVAAACSTSIQRVADRMEDLVRTLGELRASTRLEMGVVSPNEVIRETLSELEVAGRAGLETNVVLESEHAVRADPGLLRRVMENLITNAIEAMGGAGTLAVSTRDDGAEASPRVHISVADTGGGIAEDFLRERLFRPFATTKPKGLGLGLWQCRMIVQAHGGEISVESRPGKGTVFHVALDGVLSHPQMSVMRQPTAVTTDRVVDGYASRS